MVSAPYRSSQSSNSSSGPSHAPMVAIKHPKASSSKSRTPWPLDTFWPSSSKRATPTKSRSPVSPVLGCSYDSSTGLDSDQNFDFNDLPLTPPDSGASAFELHVASKPAPSTGPQDEPILTSTAAASSVLLQDDQSKPSHEKGRSKNDIFNSPISWLTPPSRMAPLSDAETSPPPPSRNSLFFSSFGSSSPTPPSLPPPRISSVQSNNAASAMVSATQAGQAPPAATQSATISSAASTSQQATGRKKGHSRNSSLGRASSEECLQEEARIRATKHVDFRLCPSNEFLLGEGRHCSVYLGSYRPRPDSLPANSTDVVSTGPWRLCAVKRLHADRQSQLLGLEEAFALRRLGVHPNIIKLIDIRDEVEFTASPQPTPEPRDHRGEELSAGLGLGLGLPRIERRSGSTTPAGHSSHSRSTSDMTGRDELLHEAQTHKRALAHEKQHEAAFARGILPESDEAPQHRTRVMTAEQSRSSVLPNPTFLVQGPEGDAHPSQAESRSDQSLVRRPSPNPMDPPRLLILLELLPNNLALFARKHSERVDLQQWFDWALQMSEALVFLHEKGCVHADIKKENMLLTEDLSIKLCDFNSAVFPNPNDPPRDGLGLGTPAYCAPELSRATGGPGATSFSYPIDVFSLGAVLYSLATGYEPFSKARSVVEMLHRKRLFFESEENDRASRLAVEAGSNPNSQPASRSGSMRGRHQKTHSSGNNDAAHGSASPAQLASSLNRLLQYGSPPSQRRDASNDSLESVASSITTISGRNPTSLAVARLLEPTDEPRGLLVDPSMPSRQSSLLRELNKADVRRAASTGGRKAVPASNAGLARLRAGEELHAVAPSPRSAPVDEPNPSATNPIGPDGSKKSAVAKLSSLEATSRPDWLRRRSSYGDDPKPHTSAAYLSPSATIAENTTAEIDCSTTPSKPSRLRAMFSPTTPHFGQSATPSPPGDQADLSHQANEAEQEDTRSYADGHPPIILPGGGRLPDWARDMLRSMLQASPEARPTAMQVREMLRSHSHRV